jgi:hypothetical protein
MITTFSDRFNFDGVFLSSYHSPPPEHADQFGFNEPVVKSTSGVMKKYPSVFDLRWRDLEST